LGCQFVSEQDENSKFKTQNSKLKKWPF
jgi:hypothetical protein